MKWRDHAACLGAPTHLFITNKVAPSRKDMELAKAYCAICPVVDDCLEYVMSFPTDTIIGVWAGMGTRERRLTLRKRQLSGSQS